jgi:hypothetical protein
MKNIKTFAVLAIMAAGIAFNSCKKSYLDQPALGALSADQVATASGVQGLLVGAYAGLDGSGVGAWESAADNWVYGSVVGGDAHKGSDGTDQPPIAELARFEANSSNAFMSTRWRSLYEGITRANNTIRAATTAAGLSAADKANILGQARFLRGHYYFELKKMFGMVPYIDETVTNFVQPNDKDIYPNIEADFQFAFTNLPPTQPQVGRVNKWAAEAYLGKVYLFEKKYPDADKAFADVIANGVNSAGVKYDLNDNFEDNFNASTKNNKETVFAVQQAANDGTGGIQNANTGDMLNFPYGSSPFRCCGFFQPSLDLANSYRTDANGLPYIADYNSHPVANDMGKLSSQAFTPDAGNLDPRIDWTVGRRGLPYLDWGYHPGADWIRLQSYAGPYAPKKNLYFKATADKLSDQHSWAPGTANQINIIRFADVLLMEAEIKANTSDLAGAQALVNRVRNRAANHASWNFTYANGTDGSGGYTTTPAANYVIKPYPAGSFLGMGQAGALKAIYFERKIELAMEGERFFDIVRWGTAQAELQKYFDFDGKTITDIQGAHFTPGKSELYPIPLDQIDAQKVNGVSTLKQNPGYSN